MRRPPPARVVEACRQSFGGVSASTAAIRVTVFFFVFTAICKSLSPLAVRKLL